MLERIITKIKSLIHGFGLDHFPWEVMYFSLGVTFSVLLIELLFVGWGKSSLKKLIQFDKSTRSDCICWLMDTFNISNVFGFVFSFGIFYFLVGLIQKNFGLNLITHIANPYLQVAIIFIAGDFKNYVRHFAFHKSKTLWELHQFHHSATHFNVLTRQRVHFLDPEISRFFDVMVFVLLGSPIYSYLAVRIFKEAHQLMIHSSFTSDWGFIGKYILVSPAAHRLHHSTEERHYNKNMGNTFIFWDRIFGTYHPAENIKEIGLPENKFNKDGYLKDLWKCLVGVNKIIFHRNKVDISKKENE